MGRTIEIRIKQGTGLLAGSAVSTAEIEKYQYPPEMLELVVDGQVLDRDGELALREDLIREERQKHAQEMKVEKPSLRQWFASIFHLPLARGAFMAGRAKSIDVAGRYQPNVDFEKLLDVDGWWIKAVEVDDTSDPNGWLYPLALEFLDRVYKLRKPAIMYVFVNTAIWLRRQVDEAKLDKEDSLPDTQRAQAYIENDPQIRAILRQIIVGESWMTDWTKVKGASKRAWTTIALDMERYWMSYTDWYANGANCQKVGDFWIRKTCVTLYDRLQWLMMRGYIPTYPIVYNYTGYWFTSQYSPSLGDWLAGKPNWLASYYWGAGSVQTTWAGIVALLDAIPDTWRPKYVYNKLPEVIQISGDRFIIPEIRNSQNVARTIDVNLHWQTREEWYKSIGFAQTEPEPEPEPEPSDLEELKKAVTALQAKQAALEAKTTTLEAWKQRMAEANKE